MDKQSAARIQRHAVSGSVAYLLPILTFPSNRTKQEQIKISRLVPWELRIGIRMRLRLSRRAVLEMAKEQPTAPKVLPVDSMESAENIHAEQ